MTTWLTSDLHFWHANIIKYCNRPYKTVEIMNEKLVENYNKVVHPDDTVYCLGDFSLAFRPVELFTNRLMGNKKLIPGNHDFCSSYNKKSRNTQDRLKWIEKYTELGWEVLPEQTILDIEGVGTVNLCHFPYPNCTGDHHEESDKYSKMRPIDDGKWLLHGHSHTPGQLNLKKRMIDIGVDANNYTPVNIDHIRNMINAPHRSTK